MLSHCANSQCSKPFVRLGEGKLFLVSREDAPGAGRPPSSPPSRNQQPLRQVERYWLCDQCSQVSTLFYDGANIELLPLSGAARLAATKRSGRTA